MGGHGEGVEASPCPPGLSNPALGRYQPVRQPLGLTPDRADPHPSPTAGS
jgi:hypothetical protein